MWSSLARRSEFGAPVKAGAKPPTTPRHDVIRAAVTIALRPPDPHENAEHPQLLDHRAHRPRQDDALRPAHGAHGRAHAARDDRAVPGLDGPRARARDH